MSSLPDLAGLGASWSCRRMVLVKEFTKLGTTQHAWRLSTNFRCLKACSASWRSAASQMHSSGCSKGCYRVGFKDDRRAALRIATGEKSVKAIWSEVDAATEALISQRLSGAAFRAASKNGVSWTSWCMKGDHQRKPSAKLRNVQIRSDSRRLTMEH